MTKPTWSAVDFYPEARFGGFSDVDGTVKFYSRVNALVQPNFTVLDVGCGRAAFLDDPCQFRRGLRVLQGKCRRVMGIDVDESAAQNPFVDEFRRIEAQNWPIENGSIDLCYCDYVLEHVADPDAFFAEGNRVLKPEGWFCARTPNLLGYATLLSRLIPNRWHGKIVTRVKAGVQEGDVFPTYYRGNTTWRLRALLRRHGFDGLISAHEAEPGYLSFLRSAYALGVLYARWVPRTFRANLFVFAQKTKDVGTAAACDLAQKAAA